jgi:hypothetical protein
MDSTNRPINLMDLIHNSGESHLVREDDIFHITAAQYDQLEGTVLRVVGDDTIYLVSEEEIEKSPLLEAIVKHKQKGSNFKVACLENGKQIADVRVQWLTVWDDEKGLVRTRAGYQYKKVNWDYNKS